MKKSALIEKIKVLAFSLNEKDEEIKKLTSDRLSLALDKQTISMRLNKEISGLGETNFKLATENQELKRQVQLKEYEIGKLSNESTRKDFEIKKLESKLYNKGVTFPDCLSAAEQFRKEDRGCVITLKSEKEKEIESLKDENANLKVKLVEMDNEKQLLQNSYQRLRKDRAIQISETYEKGYKMGYEMAKADLTYFDKIKKKIIWPISNFTLIFK